MKYLWSLLCSVSLFGSALANGQNQTDKKTAHDFVFESIDGGELPLSSFRGQTVLVVNTASFCGFTGQYEALQSLWDQYREAGLVVLGVPSNDFGKQEPGSNEEIRQFCTYNYNINFPMTQKVSVRGEQAHPFYQWVSSQVGVQGQVRWNFYKYLIAPDGQLVDWFSSMTPPLSPKIVRALEAQLPHTAPAH
ncbi:glutathione peroxidase [Kiloniella sp. b19]|uniref:glutathione peroxidase n=1 Tax=Kiloniella sp. GXU_MW_B19 TaxID=3141326 RepID=UPI0031DF4E02